MINRIKVITVLLALAGALLPASAQVPRNRQNIAPVYEGWEQNPDGSFNLVFGYFNRNWDDEILAPIGAQNSIEPGGPDQGQPTRFYPRRNRFLFRIRVPKDFGTKELVWTLTVNGQTERAYATLKPDYVINDGVFQANNGVVTGAKNDAPVLTLEGEPTRRVKAGSPVVLAALAKDDGLPRRAPMARPTGRTNGTPITAMGLRFSWFVYRGAGKVSFDPPQFRQWEDDRDGQNSPWSTGWSTPPVPPDGKWVIRATFHDPGTYVLRGLAHDGGLFASKDLTFVVE